MNRDILPVELHTGRHNSALFDFPDVLGHILLSSRVIPPRSSSSSAEMQSGDDIQAARDRENAIKTHSTLASLYPIEMIFFTSFSFIHLLSSPSLSPLSLIPPVH